MKQFTWIFLSALLGFFTISSGVNAQTGIPAETLDGSNSPSGKDYHELRDGLKNSQFIFEKTKIN